MNNSNKKHDIFIRKSEFLQVVYDIYNNKSIEYLTALKDALGVLIINKVNDGNYLKDIQERTHHMFIKVN